MSTEMPLLYSSALASVNYAGGSQISDGFETLRPSHSALAAPSATRLLEEKMLSAKAQTTPAMRLVRVIIVDTDDRIPLEKRILYNGDELLTDADDQELFLGIPVLELLNAHNEYRVTINDKKSERKDAKLDKVRVRDLTMSVVVLASFGAAD